MESCHHPSAQAFGYLRLGMSTIWQTTSLARCVPKGLFDKLLRGAASVRVPPLEIDTTTGMAWFNLKVMGSGAWQEVIRQQTRT